jgi:hypothetical protein
MADYRKMADQLQGGLLGSYFGVPVVRGKANDGRKLEFWPAGEQGAPNQPRPHSLPMSGPGVEVYSDDVRPEDVQGDIVSHHLVKSDPKVADIYQKFQNSLNIDQQNRLLQQYQWYRQNAGETRPFAQWLETSGMPAYLRGYPFQQWDDEFNQRAYTPDQRGLLDGMMRYLNTKK